MYFVGKQSFFWRAGRVADHFLIWLAISCTIAKLKEVMSENSTKVAMSFGLAQMAKHFNTQHANM